MDAANGGSAAGDATPGAQAAAKAAGLPQTEDHWHLYVHKLRTWAPLPDAAGAAAAANGEDDAEVSLELVRPYLLLLVCVTDGAFLSYASADGDAQTNVLTTVEAPTADEVVAFLCRAMAEPRVLNASMRNSPKYVFAALFISRTLHCRAAARLRVRAHGCCCCAHRLAPLRLRPRRRLRREPSHPIWLADVALPPARRRAPCRPARVSFAHTASASALRGEPELWPDADVCPYVLGCRAALEPLGVRTAFAPMPRPLLDTVVRQQIEAAFNPPDADWGTRLLPGAPVLGGACMHVLRRAVVFSTQRLRARFGGGGGWVLLRFRRLAVRRRSGVPARGRVGGTACGRAAARHLPHRAGQRRGRGRRGHAVGARDVVRRTNGRDPGRRTGLGRCRLRHAARGGRRARGCGGGSGWG